MTGPRITLLCGRLALPPIPFCTHQGHRGRISPSIAGSHIIVNGSSDHLLLDDFWQATGIADQSHRHRLIDTAFQAVVEAGGVEQQASQHLSELPGAGAFWLLDSNHAQTIEQVRHVSSRVLKLREVLGAKSGVDIAAMLLKEPRLLTTDMSLIAQRILTMRLSGIGEGGTVLAVVQAQPSLLVQQDSSCDQEETEEARQRAWKFGLMSDGAAEWARHLGELQAYVGTHGDAHAGFRAADDAELGRWAAKQRADWRAGALQPDRQRALEELGFEFDGEAAEWMRWYTELRDISQSSMYGSGQGATFYLHNWCCVQRIARRSRVLAEERIVMLEDIGFDWTGADALS